MKNFEPQAPMRASIPFTVIIIIVATLFGVGAGYGIAMVKHPAAKTQTAAAQPNGTSISTEKSEGVKDTSTFKDTAEGMLREGGIEGEGSFHLERPGGESKNVYLTSSTVDLSKFIGKKVSVLGQTNASDKAGWLMDVGYIEIK